MKKKEVKEILRKLNSLPLETHGRIARAAGNYAFGLFSVKSTLSFNKIRRVFWTHVENEIAETEMEVRNENTMDEAEDRR